MIVLGSGLTAYTLIADLDEFDLGNVPPSTRTLPIGIGRVPAGMECLAFGVQNAVVDLNELVSIVAWIGCRK